MDLLINRAASGFDGGFGSGGCANAIELDCFFDLASLNDLDHFGNRSDQASCFQSQDIDFGFAELLKRCQGDFSVVLLSRGFETALRKTTLQRHLTAFETDFVVAACT